MCPRVSLPFFQEAQSVAFCLPRLSLCCQPPLLCEQQNSYQRTSLTLRHHSGQIESNYDETTDSFDAMNLKAELLRGVYAYGFERPSAIQQRAIMPVIKGEFPPR
jgi:hypothetical protein